MFRTTLRHIASVLFALVLVGCAQEETYLSASEMFAEAIAKQAAADYEGAAELYSDVQANYPFGPYAQQSLLNLAHMQYDEARYEETLSSVQRFISEYPAHRNIDYALYLRALALQRDKKTLLDKVLFDDSANRSREAALESHAAFSQLIKQHPLSRYTPDALERLAVIVNGLAEDEIKTSIHYLRIGAYGAAMRRSSEIIFLYPDSIVLELSLAVLVASLVEMAAQEPLTDAVASLTSSFPNSALLEPAQGGANNLLAFIGLEIERGDYFTNLLE